MKSKHYLMIFALLMATACSDLNIKNQADKLDSALEDYGAALRWGRYKHAYVYHINQEGKQPVVDLNALENFSVTSFRPVDPVINQGATEATIPVEIDYYDEQYGTLRKIKYVQKWWFNIEIKRWLIASDFPKFE